MNQSTPDRFSFCRPLADMFQSETTVGRSGKQFRGLAALSSPNTLLTLRSLAMHLKPTRTLEIGLSFGGSCLVLAKFEFDLVYVDGSHLFEDVFVDFYFVSRLLSPAGIVVFDDSTDRHVAKVIRFIRANCRESFHEFDLSPFRADKGRSLRYRAARRLKRTQLTAFRRIGNIERAWDSPFVSF